ncbi:alpha-glucuronidase, partial [candidate division KSB1 bacterium]|nr:alpha-glucuronidase [candidate division KSB1 bacterium]
MKKFTFTFILLSTLLAGANLRADDGYRLWLKYDMITNPQKLQAYKKEIKGWMIVGDSPTLTAAQGELQIGLNGLLGIATPNLKQASEGAIIAAVYANISSRIASDLSNKLDGLGPEGFVILNTTVDKKRVVLITANSDIGVLYGVFHFLRLLQTHEAIENLDITSSPRIKLRVLNHWDNLNRTVERGYAGFSLWDWHRLPDYIHPYYRDYARANASLGINGTVLNNVNANALILTPHYLEKVAALANVFRPYGLRVYLSIRFSAPIDIGGLKVSDPLDPQVQQWWKKKAEEIYELIPDFGGFLVKANSEGQ